ncbi:D-glycero-beta-D-manno-heptose 1,7-bisphosphate 7-phosphatase [Herpetosiphon sp. NSE202]|uniref:D-glycero-beta-D-manno-heptose 1,7-bisphosphate 7-phosphatase n=1 Tax=Herpetosiphon sp. NSE202 TaxID=3351349 RepID=UPI003638FD21
MSQAAVFIDRDGTINVEVNYLHQPELVQLEQTVGQAIARLNQAGFLVLVVTNQSGIARGYYSAEDMQAVHRRISELLAPFNAHIDGWYYCPHHPEVTGECACRKPNLGMFAQAQAEFAIDLSRSWMIGDKLLDVQAGIHLGVPAIMVQTGYGAQHQHDLPAHAMLVANLNAAVDLIVQE